MILFASIRCTYNVSKTVEKERKSKKKLIELNLNKNHSLDYRTMITWNKITSVKLIKFSHKKKRKSKFNIRL